MTSTAGLARCWLTSVSSIEFTPSTVIQSCGVPGKPGISSIAGNRYLWYPGQKYCGGRNT